MSEKLTSFNELDSSSFPDRKVPCGLLLFGGEGAKFAFGGFDGSVDKTGIMLVKVGKGDDKNSYARSFVEYYHGFIKDRKLIKSPGLVTTAMFWVKVAGCECRDEYNHPVDERTLKPGEIFSMAKKIGLRGKSAVDVLNRLSVCPVCGKGRLVDWHQVDPLSDESLVFFDDRHADGTMVKGGLTGKERIEKLMEQMKGCIGDFKIPGVVALSRYDIKDEDLPSSKIYKSISVLAHAHERKLDDGSTEKDPFRCDLLNNLEEDSEIVKLVLAAEEYTVGEIGYSFIDKGFASDPTLPYKVKLQVFCNQASQGIPPILKSKAWADQARARKTARLRETVSEF